MPSSSSCFSSKSSSLVFKNKIKSRIRSNRILCDRGIIEAGSLTMCSCLCLDSKERGMQYRTNLVIRSDAVEE